MCVCVYYPFFSRLARGGGKCAISRRWGAAESPKRRDRRRNLAAALFLCTAAAAASLLRFRLSRLRVCFVFAPSLSPQLYFVSFEPFFGDFCTRLRFEGDMNAVGRERERKRFWCGAFYVFRWLYSARWLHRCALLFDIFICAKGCCCASSALGVKGSVLLKIIISMVFLLYIKFTLVLCSACGNPCS